MKNLTNKPIKNRFELFKGNNIKFLKFKNSFKDNFLRPVINELSLTFFDLATAKTFIGITDENDVNEWNDFFADDSYSTFNSSNGYVIFESVIVTGNKVEFIPVNNDYSQLQEFYFYGFFDFDEDLLSGGVLTGDFKLETLELDSKDTAFNFIINPINNFANDDFILDVESRNIESFVSTGDTISQLTQLIIRDNLLTELDLANSTSLYRLLANDNANLVNPILPPSLRQINLSSTIIETFTHNLPLLTLLTLNLCTELVTYNFSLYPNLINLSLESIPSLTNFDYTLPNIEVISLNNCSNLTIFDYSGYPQLTNLYLDNTLTNFIFNGDLALSNLQFLSYKSNTVLQTFNSLGLNNLNSLYLDGCTSLVTIEPSNLNSLFDITASNCALSETSVNELLAKLVANGYNSGTLIISGGTNSAPTGQGITDLATLNSRGWYTETN